MKKSEGVAVRTFMDNCLLSRDVMHAQSGTKGVTSLPQGEERRHRLEREHLQDRLRRRRARERDGQWGEVGLPRRRRVGVKRTEHAPRQGLELCGYLDSQKGSVREFKGLGREHDS